MNDLQRHQIRQDLNAPFPVTPGPQGYPDISLAFSAPSISTVVVDQYANGGGRGAEASHKKGASCGGEDGWELFTSWLMF